MCKTVIHSHRLHQHTYIIDTPVHAYCKHTLLRRFNCERLGSPTMQLPIYSRPRGGIRRRGQSVGCVCCLRSNDMLLDELTKPPTARGVCLPSRRWQPPTTAYRNHQHIHLRCRVSALAPLPIYTFKYIH